MKALAALAFEALIEAWYPAVPEGEKRKVKASAAGLALALVLVGGLLGFMELRTIRAELADVKTTTASIWTALVQRGAIASQQPPAGTNTPTPHAFWPPSFFPSVSAAEPIP